MGADRAKSTAFPKTPKPWHGSHLSGVDPRPQPQSTTNIPPPPRTISTAPSTSSIKRYGNPIIGLKISLEGPHQWLYTTVTPPTGWQKVDFATSTNWLQGSGAFGTYAEKNATGLRNKTKWKSKNIWLRTTVDLPDSITNARVTWRYFHDEGLEVYVNGKDVFRDSWFTNVYKKKQFDEPNGLQPGKNLIAVHCHNEGQPGVIDVGFEWQPLQK